MPPKPLNRGALKEGDVPTQRRLEIGASIRRLRDAKNWSQETLAHQVGCSMRVISRVENGESALYFHLLDTIAGVLGVSPREVMPREPLALDNGSRPVPAQRLRPPPPVAKARPEAKAAGKAKDAPKRIGQASQRSKRSG